MNAKIQFYDHPYYAAKARGWQTLKDLCEGDHQVLSGNTDYLWSHEIESHQKGRKLRAIRMQRSRYFNLIEPSVDRWVSFIVKNIQTEKLLKAIKEEELNDITGSGISLESFIKDYITFNNVLYGRPIIRIDSFESNAITLGQARERRERPFLEIVNPLTAKDWAYAKTSSPSQFQSFRQEYIELKPRSTLQEKPTLVLVSREDVLSGKEVKYSYYYKDLVSTKGKLDSGWTKSDEGVIQLEQVPIVSIENQDSWLSGAKEQALLIYNYMSTESCVINAQSFQRIFVAGDLQNKDKLEMGVFLATFLPKDSVVTTVEPTSIEPIASRIDASVSRFFKSAFNQVYSLSSDSKESMSAEAQAEMKDDFIQSVQAAAKQVEELTNRALRIYCKFKNIDLQESISITPNANKSDIDKEIAIWQAFKDELVKVMGVRREMAKRAIEHLNLSDAETLKAEAEKTNFDTNTDTNIRDSIVSQLNG